MSHVGIQEFICSPFCLFTGITILGLRKKSIRFWEDLVVLLVCDS